MEWINTKDQMPPNDDGRWILFVFEGEVKMGSFDRYKSGNYWVDFHNTRYHIERVHYWMPLPEVPAQWVEED